MLEVLSATNFSFPISTLADISSVSVEWIGNMTPMLASEPNMIQQWVTHFYNILLVALGLGFVIFVHELGHFLAAKSFGVKCEKFYIGFDVPIKIGPIRLPSKLVHFKWGETEYGIGAIPLGGYVKMLGQDDDPRRAEEELQRIRKENPNAAADDPDRVQLDPRSFPAKSVGARMVIISAGVIMNLFFGVLMAAWAFHSPATPTSQRIRRLRKPTPSAGRHAHSRRGRAPRTTRSSDSWAECGRRKRVRANFRH